MSGRRDFTVAVTFGRWGGFYCHGLGMFRFRRLCLGWVAVTLMTEDVLALERAYLNELDAADAEGSASPGSCSGVSG